MECFITFVICLWVSINPEEIMMECFITTVICLRLSNSPRRDNDGMFHYLCHLFVGINQPKKVGRGRVIMRE